MVVTALSKQACSATNELDKSGNASTTDMAVWEHLLHDRVDLIIIICGVKFDFNLVDILKYRISCTVIMFEVFLCLLIIILQN